MAGNKMNSKGNKSKDDKVKPNKVVTQSNEDCEDPDFALLRKPINTSVTGLAQARKIFDWATEELKDLLSNECDLLYECKVCRNIFRSLANFISHKRVYCKEKFSSTVHAHFIANTSMGNEFLKIKNIEQGYQEYLKRKNGPNSADFEEPNRERIPMSKDLTEIIENIAMTKRSVADKDQQVVLQKIPSSSVAVFQNINTIKKPADFMRAQVTELDKIMSQDQAVLQNDGKFKVESSKDNDIDQDQSNVIQISDDDDDNVELKCKLCNLQFSTQKTLKFHMKHKHLESRLVYPCPDCLEIFSTSWSVYRHLFKVHRKTAAQIRRLRESIQAKAFKMDNIPAFYEKRKKPVIPQSMTEEERLDQEHQAWMDNMECDGSGPRCGGCGRGFERRAALMAHTHTCAHRHRALTASSGPSVGRKPDKKIEIQIRKDYNKGPAYSILKPDDKSSNEEHQATGKTIESNDNKSMENDKDENLSDENPMDIPDEEKSNDSIDFAAKNKVEDLKEALKPAIRLPFAMLAEKSNLAAFMQRVKPDIDAYKVSCKKCDTCCKSLSELFEHMAEHYKWMRYACKLCNFKHYSFLKLPEHVKIVHKLKGDTDFYFSTIKAIDGTEAMLNSKYSVDAEVNEEPNENNESPESRRPSRCSSDSSRLSDDSYSSNYVKETVGRKRKLHPSKVLAKKKKESNDDQKDGDMSNDKDIKVFEDNSSDMDDIEDKITKKYNSNDSISSVASRRPVRKKTKPKNEDFEYDLSNLLKMEAQGYRDSLTTTTTKATTTTKKKSQVEVPNINKDHSGALYLLSKKATDKSAALMKTSSFGVYSLQKDPRTSNIFVKPLPKLLAKSSPKKDTTDDSKDSSPTKSVKEIESALIKENSVSNVPSGDEAESKDDNAKSDEVSKKIYNSKEQVQPTKNTEEITKNETASEDSSKKKIPPVVPATLRHQSMALIKNPIINKSITDFTKAGMKTKILVIKPINRGKDGISKNSTPLKFQTIKLKDTKGSSSSEEKSSDQVMVVKVPTVDSAMSRPVPENNTANSTSTEVNDNNTKNDENLSEKNACEVNDVKTLEANEKEEVDEVCDKNETAVVDNDVEMKEQSAGSEITESAS